jgi:hypothetical protein
MKQTNLFLILLTLLTMICAPAMASEQKLGMPKTEELKALRVWIDSQPIISLNSPIPQFSKDENEILFKRFPAKVLALCCQVSWNWNEYILALPNRKFYSLQKMTAKEETKDAPLPKGGMFGQFELPYIDPLTPISLNLFVIEDPTVVDDTLSGILRSHKVSLVLVSSKGSIVETVKKLDKGLKEAQQFLVVSSSFSDYSTKLKPFREWIDQQPTLNPNTPIPQLNAALTQLLFERFPIHLQAVCRQVSWRWNNYILALPGRKFYCLQKSTVEEETNVPSAPDREVFGKFELPCIGPTIPISLNLLSIEDPIVMKEILAGILRSHVVKLVLVSSKKEVVDAVIELDKSFPPPQQFLIASSPPFWNKSIRKGYRHFEYGEPKSRYDWNPTPPSTPVETFATVLHLASMPKISIYVLLRTIASNEHTALAFFSWFKENNVNPGVLGPVYRVCHTRDLGRNYELLITFSKIPMDVRTPVAKQAAKFVDCAPSLYFSPFIKTFSLLLPEIRELIASEAPAIFTRDCRLSRHALPTISTHLCEVIASKADSLKEVDVCGFINYFRLLFLYGHNSQGGVQILSQNLTLVQNFTTTTLKRLKAYLSLATLIDPRKSIKVYDALENLCLKFGARGEDKFVLGLREYFARNQKDSSVEEKLETLKNITQS